MSRSIVIHSDKITELEIAILVNILGLLSALEYEVITTREAEKYLLNPFRNDWLREFGMSEDILNILDESGFLDDSKTLGNASFQSSLVRLKNSVVNSIKDRNGDIATLAVRLQQ